MKWWQTTGPLAIDVESTGLDWHHDRVFGVALAWFDNGQIKSEYHDIRREPEFLAELTEKAPDITRPVNHHIKYDAHMLMNHGINLPLNRCECTMVRAALMNEHLRRYDLDTLSSRWLNERKVSTIYEELAGMFGGEATREAQMPNLHKAPVEMVAPYGRVDAELALRLWAYEQDEIDRVGLQQVVDLERRLFPVIFDMERRGVRVDIEEAELRMQMIGAEVEKLEKKLEDMAGFYVNPNPSSSIHKLFEPKQISDDKWRLIDGTICPSTDAGKASIGAEVLQVMTHPAAALILQARKLKKARDTFLAKHVLEKQVNGYVHPHINQTKTEDDTGTGTGRLSYTKPALQQIPNRDKKTASIVRPVFLPDPDQGWSYGDLDQHELRIFHHYVNNPEIIDAYKRDPDLDGHQIVADLTGLPRSATATSGMANAKQMNLAMVFNMGGGSLAQVMGLPTVLKSFEERGTGKIIEYVASGPEAQAIIDSYHQKVPGVKALAAQAKNIAKTRGYVRTLKGRHIHFPNPRFAYKASGLVCQGTAGDLNKENCCRIAEYLAAECPEGRLLLNIHDEYSVSLPFGGKSIEHLRNIKALIEDRPELRLPLRIDFSGLESNWWEATKAEAATL